MRPPAGIGECPIEAWLASLRSVLRDIVGRVLVGVIEAGCHRRRLGRLEPHGQMMAQLKTGVTTEVSEAVVLLSLIHI